MFDCIVNKWKPARELSAELNVFQENADFLSSSFGDVLHTYAHLCTHTFKLIFITVTKNCISFIMYNKVFHFLWDVSFSNESTFSNHFSVLIATIYIYIAFIARLANSVSLEWNYVLNDQ